MFDWIIIRLLGAPVAPDPIDHPDIRALSMRDLADMPLPRHSLPPHPQPVARFAPSWGKTALSPPIAVIRQIGEGRRGQDQPTRP